MNFIRRCACGTPADCLHASGACVSCVRRAQKRAYHKKNAAQIKAKKAAAYQKNREARLATCAKYRAAHREERRLYQEQYRAKFGNVSPEYHKAWRQKNPERVAAAWRKRRFGERAVPWADRDAIARLYEEARRLTRETGIKHHVDHIVPLHGKTVCGLHVEHNLRVIPADENKRKHAKLIEELL